MDTHTTTTPTAQAPAVRILDLFSGVGGFSYALRHIGRTVAYCEVNPMCRAVLRGNMQRGGLDQAPVFEDVTKLTGADLQELRPAMLTAGFPCQDICTAGGGKGLDGARSGLFFHIPRLVQEVPTIKHVLLENSPNIKNLGLQRVLDELSRAGLTHVAYGFFSASDVGALHRRTRWVCVASRCPNELPLLVGEQLHAATQSHEWTSTAVPRVVPRPAQGNGVLLRRCGMLGNAVVPQFIAHAYSSLARVLQQTQMQTQTQTPAHEHTVPQLSTSHKGKQGVIHASHDGSATLTLHPYAQLANNTLELRLVSDDGTLLQALPRWYTPLHDQRIWHQGRTIQRGSRMLHNLANNIYYEQDTPCPGAACISQRSRMYTVNPEFVEHLMGYPAGWTVAETETQ